MAKTTAIRAPTTDPVNHQIVLRQLKEASETASRLRGNARDSFAQVGELLDAGIVRFVDGKLVAPSPSSLPPTVVPTTRKIDTGGSLTGGGSLVTDITLSLVNDIGTPGNNMLYGTNTSGVKGWYAQPSGGGGSTGVNVTPDTHPSLATNWDDEFETGSSIDTTGTRFSGANPWSWINQNSATAVVGRGNVILVPPQNGGAFSYVAQTTPSGTWKFRAKMSVPLYNTNGPYGGLLLYNSANGHNVFFGAAYNSFISGCTPGVLVAVSSSWPSGGGATSHIPTSTSVVGSPTVRDLVDYWYYEIDYDGTNLSYLISRSGVDGSFVQVYSGTASSDLGAAPTHIGLASASYVAGIASMVVCDWFRRVA